MCNVFLLSSDEPSCAQTSIGRQVLHTFRLCLELKEALRQARYCELLGITLGLAGRGSWDASLKVSLHE